MLAAAAIVGLVAGVLHYRGIAQTTGAAIARESARWLAQPPRDPHSATHFGQTAFHRRSVLSAIDSGVDPYVGVSVFLEAHKRNLPRYPWSADTPRWSGLGHYTAATALRLLMPLFLVLLAHGAIVGERERGTLAMAVASGVAPAAIVMGKLMGVALALGAILVPFCAASATTLALVAATPARADWVARAAGLVVVYLLYAFVFLAVALLVSARARTTAWSRAALFAFWAVTALVAPRVVPELASWAHPVPSALELRKALDEDPDRYLGIKGRDEFRRTVLADYGVTAVDQLPVNFDGLWAMKSEEHTNRLIDEHYSALDRALAASARIIALGSVLTPTLAIDGVSMALAGSDLAHYHRFLYEAELHRRTMVRLLNEDLARHPDARRAGYQSGRDVWASIPTFDLLPPDLLWSLNQARAPLVALIAWVVLAAILLLYAARRLARTPPIPS